MLLDSHHTVFTFSTGLDLLSVVTGFLDFHSNNLKITSKVLTQGYRYHKLRKTFGKFSKPYSEILSKGDISFQEYVSAGIFYGDQVYKLRRVKGAGSEGSRFFTSSYCPNFDRP